MPRRPAPDVPLRSARHVPTTTWHERRRAGLGFGDRAADVVRNGMGSWRFVFAFLAFMAVWALVNSLTRGWDPYPYILLNLMLSMVAGLQGAILLIAAKRQDAVAADLARHDYDTNVAAKHDVETLLAVTAEQAAALRALHADVARLLAALPRDAGAVPVDDPAVDGDRADPPG